MITVSELRECLDEYEDDEPLHFVVMNHKDMKYIDRAWQNNVRVHFEYPVLMLDFIAAGAGGDVQKKEYHATIYLCGRNDKR